MAVGGKAKLLCPANTGPWSAWRWWRHPAQRGADLTVELLNIEKLSWRSKLHRGAFDETDPDHGRCGRHIDGCIRLQQTDRGRGTASEATATTQAANAQAQELKLMILETLRTPSEASWRPSGKVMAADGSVLHDYDAYQFVTGQRPIRSTPACGATPASMLKWACSRSRMGHLPVTWF